MKNKRIISFFMCIIMLLVSTLNVSAIAGSSNEEIIEIGNYTITTLAKSPEYSKILIVDNETGNEETLESFTTKGKQREFVIRSGHETMYLVDYDSYIEIYDDSGLIESYDKDFGDVISLRASWGSPSYFSGDRHTDVGNLSLVIAIIAAISGAQIWVQDVITIAEFVYTNNVPNIWYSGVRRTKWEDGLYYTWTITDFFKNSSRTQFINTVDFIDFH